MQRHFLSEKETEELIEKIKEKYNISLSPQKVEIGKEKKEVYYFLDGVLSFFSQDLIPTLCAIYKFNISLPSVKVDEGAVRAVLKGADLFVPGIKEYDCSCKPGDIIAVTTMEGKAIAIMKVLISKEDAEKEKRGKFSKNLHYLGDEIWKMCK
ncbi:MAG: RNA-binding protein [Acidianus sp.]|jgi:PUA domain protein|nr:RNA-binding protein [Acidianus sp.]